MTIRASAIRDLADLIVQHGQGKARFAFSEKDDSREPSDAVLFLKVNEHRVGKDLSTYGLLGEHIEGWQRVLPTIYLEILVPVKAAGLEDSFKAAALKLKELATCVYDMKLLKDWDELLGLTPPGHGNDEWDTDLGHIYQDLDEED